MHFLREKPKGPMVRSFLCYSKGSEDMPEIFAKSIPEAFDLLRILDVEPIKFKKFPSAISRLIHLRYIEISGEELDTLSTSISTLWNLQTIIIHTMSRTFEIKANIWKMIHLRHLKSKADIVINNEAEGEAGKSLQTLSRLSAKCVTKDLCSRILNIKKLGIRGDLRNLLRTNCLARLERLEKLKLVHDVKYGSVYLHYPESLPPNLMILELSSTHLDWWDMKTLAMIPTLEVLKLKDNAFVGKYWRDYCRGFPLLQVLLISNTDLKYWEASRVSFPNLRSLVLISNTNFQYWDASSDSFPNLRSLVLKNCMELQRIPHELNIYSLKVLDIERVSESVVEQIKERERYLQGGAKMTELQDFLKFSSYATLGLLLPLGGR